MRSSVLFWNLLISLRATVPGRNLWGFLTPPVAGADFLAALVASCFLGAFPPVDLRAVCLVRAMVTVQMLLMLVLGVTLALAGKEGSEGEVGVAEAGEAGENGCGWISQEVCPWEDE